MSDKPMECNKCIRKAEVHYKEMKEGKVRCSKMCKSCPLLKDKLYESTTDEGLNLPIFNHIALKCPVCATTHEEFMITLTLGCDCCAETFKDTLSEEIQTQGIIPTRLALSADSPFHFGTIPKTNSHQEFSKTIETLHTALNEAIRSEHFEEAADIRDQIKIHLENPNART
jgi:protein-arginine kinase activator protein McsA